MRCSSSSPSTFMIMPKPKPKPKRVELKKPFSRLLMFTKPQTQHQTPLLLRINSSFNNIDIVSFFLSSPCCTSRVCVRAPNQLCNLCRFTKILATVLFAIRMKTEIWSAKDTTKVLEWTTNSWQDWPVILMGMYTNIKKHLQSYFKYLP